MRKIVLGLGLLSASVLLSGMEGAPKKPFAHTDKINALSQCDPKVNNFCNIVSNCGFERGDFSFWAQSGNTSFTFVDGNPHSGDFALITGPVNDLGFISQNLPTDPGMTYFLKFWLRTPTPPNHFQVIWDGTLVMDTTDASASCDYVQFEIDDLPAASTSTELVFGFYNPPDYFFFDDVVVCPTLQ
jgi:hypothetical protein